MDIDKPTKEFATTILTTDEFVEFQAASKQFDGNKEARVLMEDVQDKKQTIVTLKQTGLPVSETQEGELEAAFAKMRSNPICMRIIKAQNAALQLARKISNQLTNETGIPFTSGGGCCG